MCLDGSDGVDFLATDTKTPQESGNQSVKQVEEDANQHNTFMREAIPLFNSISNNPKKFEGYAREAIVEIFKQSVNNQRRRMIISLIQKILVRWLAKQSNAGIVL